MDRIFIYIATGFFFVGFCAAFWSLRRGTYRVGWRHIILMAGGFLSQCAFLWLRGQKVERCPLTNPAELLIFVAWSMVLLYFLIGTAYRWSLLGLFTAPMVFFFHVVALFSPDPAFVPEATPPARSMFWAELHKTTALLGFGAFALASVAGVMFLVQDRQLKKHQFKALFHHLPPVHNLTRATRRLMLAGLILLTLGIVFAYRMGNTGGSHSLLPIWVIWGIYAALVVYEWTRGLPARKGAWAAVLAFVLPLLSILIISHTA